MKKKIGKLIESKMITYVFVTALVVNEQIKTNK